MWLIGQEWKRGNTCSGLILIGRGLNLIELGKCLDKANASSYCSVLKVQRAFDATELDPWADQAYGCSVLKVQILPTVLCRETKEKRREAQMEFLLHTFLYKEKYAPLAQLVEQLTLNQWVLGSSPRWCTTYFFL